MHICILTTVLDPFKGGNHLPLFAALADVSFTIVCNRSKVSEEDLPPNVEVVTVPGRLGPYYYGVSDYRFAALVMKRYPVSHQFWKQFDCIHLNQVMGPAFTKLSTCGKPVLFLIHHPVTADREVAVDQTRGLQRFFWKLRYMLLVSFQKKMCKAASHIATVSRTMLDRIAHDYAIDNEKISIVPNGVDGDTFMPSEHASDIDIVAIGSFVHPRKGFSYLQTVYRALSEKGYRIADIGRRSDEQVRRLKSISGITMYGTVDEEKLLSVLSSAKVLVSTSLFEGFGLSLIEALACGRPAVAFAVGAVPEVLGSIDPTLVVPPKDTDAFVARVEEFLSLSPSEQEKRGKVYREKVLSQYSLKSSAEALKQLYTQISQ